MGFPESKYFELLKRQIVEEMKRSYPEIPDSIMDWKGQNILDFQSDLRIKVHENISEKWFYTHMKSGNSKLPRIDILNFLSSYVGFRNWDDFKMNNGNEKDNSTDNSNRVFYILPFITLIILTGFYLGFSAMYTQEYTFCFYDSDFKMPIKDAKIEITVFADDESPVNYLCGNDGCFSLKTSERSIKFLVETPYYHPDTIVRTLNKFNRTENVRLKIDDYAAMIHYISTSNVNDWLKKRRENLDMMISDSAKIFQVLNGTVGMEIYNKWEFINKLTLPVNSLRNIEVIDSRYKDGKITHLRFTQNEENE